MIVNCVIIDDEPAAIEVLSDFADRTPNLSLLSTFRNPLQALGFIRDNKVDLIFLDINMPELNGMELLKVLIHPPLVIFTTAYTEYAIESYEKNAVDYLLKPVTFERFLIAVNKAQRLLMNMNPEVIDSTQTSNANEEIIYLKSGTKTHRLVLNDVRYLEKDGHYITFYLSDKKVVARLSMKDVFEVISKTKFIQVHKSYIVSISHVNTIERHQIKIEEAYIPIGKTHRKAVHAFFKSDFDTN
ncbi:two component transcriptional regulator, LytTR family [Maribacter orientalis]|uniref:Two component transcriptional regulator, LytTR family n=1 Tax=Maribacter orientalis TaxID=228957 RepID=A0A1H7QL02_9FLAO|nr:response regulator transcription factor [Maribacter orientalis]SEL48593.1 two component transcriptional regulator, LytTR family [Maribacter orientalis]